MKTSEETDADLNRHNVILMSVFLAYGSRITRIAQTSHKKGEHMSYPNPYRPRCTNRNQPPTPPALPGSKHIGGDAKPRSFETSPYGNGVRACRGEPIAQKLRYFKVKDGVLGYLQTRQIPQDAKPYADIDPWLIHCERTPLEEIAEWCRSKHYVWLPAYDALDVLSVTPDRFFADSEAVACLDSSGCHCALYIEKALGRFALRFREYQLDPIPKGWAIAVADKIQEYAD